MEKNNLNFEQFYEIHNEYFSNFNRYHYEFFWNLTKLPDQEILTPENPITVYNIFPNNLPSDIEIIKKDIYNFFKEIKFDLLYFQKMYIITLSRVISNDKLKWLKDQNQEILFWLLENFIICTHSIDDIDISYFNKDEKNKFHFLIFNNIYKYKKFKTINYDLPYKAHKNIFEYLVFTINYKNFDKEEKYKLLDFFYANWQVKNDIITGKLDWIDRDSAYQQQWVLEYFFKKGFNFNSLIFFDISNSQKIQILYHKLFNALEPIREKFFLDTLKKSWSQKKFRDSGKTKKPYHLPLTKESIRKLDKLSEYLNKSNNRVIEELIDKKFSELIIDEKGNEKY